MVANGNIDPSQLSTVEGWALLAPGCANAWRSFDADLTNRTKLSPTITSPDGAYRSLARQQYWWSIFRKYGRPVAARPGTSNHGLGMAVDINNHGRYNRTTLVATARLHGFIFDTPSEPWHAKYIGPANYNPSGGGGTPLTESEYEMMNIVPITNADGSQKWYAVGTYRRKEIPAGHLGSLGAVESYLVNRKTSPNAGGADIDNWLEYSRAVNTP